MYWDRNLPGFGIRVTSKGRKTWVVLYRVNGRSVEETLGTTWLVPRLLDAREAARASILKARSGIHPVMERRKAAQAAETEAQQATEGRFDTVAERFLREYVAPNCSRGYTDEVRRIFAHDIFPRLGDKPVRAITKQQINALLDYKATHSLRPRKGSTGGATIQANRMLARLRTFFRWCMAHDLIDKDPSVGVLLRGKERARDRFLSDDEIRWLWFGCEELEWPYGPIFRLLLLTGQRAGEVSGMLWSELDFHTQTWTLPRQRTKSDRAHVVHLSDLAVEVINSCPCLVGDRIFPTRALSYAQGLLKTSMVAQKRAETGNNDATIEHWVIHDLRRTATTVMAEKLKIAPHVADRILNHASSQAGTVAAVYNRAAYLDERKAALEALGRYIEGLIRPGAARNIVSLRG